jgi:hypothetical protein
VRYCVCARAKETTSLPTVSHPLCVHAAISKIPNGVAFCMTVSAGLSLDSYIGDSPVATVQRVWGKGMQVTDTDWTGFIDASACTTWTGPPHGFDVQ